MTDQQATDQRSLAASLAPALHQACGNRLSDVSWFKADWQQGGAATATATYQLNSRIVPVVVKLPVVNRELRWMQRLQPNDDIETTPTDPTLVVPRLFAGDETLAGYDLAWIIIERFEHGPLGMHWNENHLQRVIDAAVRFHARAASFPIDAAPRFEDWHTLIKESRQHARDNNLEPRQRWKAALKAVAGKLDELVETWRARPIRGWVHGDLHMANAMSRVGLDDGPVSLIDLAEVRPGHWVEDAIYLERQFWASPERMKDCKPLRDMARARKQAGLNSDDDYQKLADIRRCLLAATAPRFMKSEGHPKYLQACLERLEQSLSQVA